MCNKVKTLAKNKQGQLSYCTGCKVYKLIFNNLNFELYPKQFRNLRAYVNEIEVEYWEIKHDRMPMKRKIPIPSTQQNLTMMFDKHEIVLLKSLLNEETVKPMETLAITDIDYTLFLN
ncbi:hypothetical protein LY01_00397 [Nonlabens xylanidelens]|uniref:Uncharacterized protein n=1 Tax=Nonlabens xylanidelens TaxID=191564 RepID=A0A2S6IQQ0_9FLAO|nr:DUF6686 family protein [Nonlabens xylanidelens]PPK96574.1 hypothetical protein LY01_00397 [Nonlabens xylanidelens]